MIQFAEHLTVNTGLLKDRPLKQNPGQMYYCVDTKKMYCCVDGVWEVICDYNEEEPREPKPRTKIIKYTHCKSCGAPINSKTDHCEYCDTPYVYDYVEV